PVPMRSHIRNRISRLLCARHSPRLDALRNAPVCSDFVVPPAMMYETMYAGPVSKKLMRYFNTLLCKSADPDRRIKQATRLGQPLRIGERDPGDRHGRAMRLHTLGKIL